MDTKKIEKAIYPVGFYRNKARTIQTISRDIIERYDGSVPDDLDKLLTMKGIGRKTAQRLILELKDVIAVEGEVASRGLPSEPADDAVAALLALGYNAPQAETLVRRVLPRLSSNATLEEIIKAATSLGRKTV